MANTSIAVRREVNQSYTAQKKRREIKEGMKGVEKRRMQEGDGRSTQEYPGHCMILSQVIKSNIINKYLQCTLPD